MYVGYSLKIYYFKVPTPLPKHFKLANPPGIPSTCMSLEAV